MQPPTTHPTPTESYKAEEQRLTSSFAHATYLTLHNSIVDISYFMYGEKPQQKHCKPYGIPNAHNHPVKH